MFARSTTFQGKPANLRAGIKFIENEAGPTLDATAGCRGVSMLVDRTTGLSIVTSSWSDESALHDSDPLLRPLRDQARDILGGPMQVDEWEVGLMYRSDHGECCRVSWMQGEVGSMLDTFRVAVLPQLKESSGFCSASLLVDAEADLCCVTTAWESGTAMVASRSLADDLRSRIAVESGGNIVDVQEFDLAYAHLHVPEMA